MVANEFGVVEALVASKQVREKIIEMDAAPTKSTDRALDIFTTLKQSDKQNYGYYDELSDRAKKEFSPWLIQRWLASQKLELVNELTNPLISQVPPDLAWKLLCAIGMPTKRRYKWMTPPKQLSGGKSELMIQLIAEYYSVSTRVAKDYARLLTSDQIIDIALAANIEKKQLTSLKKSLT